MFGAIFNFLLKWLVIFFTGLVIKLMDDYLDQEIDKIEGKYSLVMYLDKAILPYALLCIVLCMSIYPGLTGSLFISSYIIGMGHNFRQKLPLGWTALQEFILFGVLGIIIFGFKEMVGSFLVILFVQIVDDFLDYYTDSKFVRRNLVIRFGFWETLIIAIITLFSALLLDPEKTFLVSVSLPVILLTIELGKRYIHNE